MTVSRLRLSAALVALVASLAGAILLAIPMTPAAGLATEAGMFNPLTPTRVLDTRTGVGGVLGAVPARQGVRLHLLGVAGVPSSSVSAVVLNVTVTEPQEAGFLSVYPDGAPLPNVSNLNFSPGQTVPNEVIVPVGLDGSIQLFNGSWHGSTQVIADLSGYYLNGASTKPGAFHPLDPARVLDSRSGTGGVFGAIPARQAARLKVTGVAGVPTGGVSAVVLNVTATEPAATGYVTVYPDFGTPPGVSNLNFVAGQTVPNLVVVPVSSAGYVDLFNGSYSGAVQLIGDISGYYTGGLPTTAGAFGSAAPSRILDTRYGTGAVTGPVQPHSSIRLHVTGLANVPSTNVSAIILNVTVTDTKAAGFATVYPDGTALPGVSNLNFTPGQTVPNLVIVPVNGAGDVALYNGSGGTMQFVADVYGYYLTSTVASSTPTSGTVSTAPKPSQAAALSIGGLDLHDGTVQKFGDTYYMYGTRYGCGFNWGQPSPWCGFGVSTAKALTGPWSAPVQLFAPSDVDYLTNGPWTALCGDSGRGCFNPRMVRRTWGPAGTVAGDGAFLLWFNAPQDSVAGRPNAYYVMTCSGPTGPCGDGARPNGTFTHKPNLQVCGAIGDFTIVTGTGGNPDIICTGGDQTLLEEDLLPSGIDGAGHGGGLVAGLRNVESPGAYRDPATGKWILTYSDPNCGFCAGDGTGYALGPSSMGPWTAPTNSGAAAPGTGRRDISATSCGGQPRTVFVVDGQAWEWIDTWALWSGEWVNQARAGVILASLDYTPSTATAGGLLAAQFAQWPCS